MKVLFTLSSLVSVIITGMVSIRLFEHTRYDASALLTITSFLTIILLIGIVGSKKIPQ